MTEPRPDRRPGDAERRPVRRVAPVVAAIRRLSAVAWAAVLVVVVVAALLVLALANPGERVGPVRPADPPVGSDQLPPP